MKRDEVKQLVERGVRELNEALAAGKSDRLQAYLDMMSRFPKYSFNNQLLICLQFPDATMIQGFHAWRKMKRIVKKGEKGIGIIAPMIRKKDEERHSTGSDGASKTIFGFKVVHVFDVSQTEGEPLPEFSKATGDPGENIITLESLIRSYGIELEYDVIPGGALGVSKKGKIVVRPGLEPAETCMVLIHEMSHELLHQSDRRSETTKTIRETEAEAVAHVVGQALGLQSLEQSADYIQLYNGDEKVLMESMDQIQKTAAEILEGIRGFATSKDVPTEEVAS